MKMKNSGVKCNVCECMHNVQKCGCDLNSIEVTNEKTTANAVNIPHFCKSFEEK